MSAPTHAHPDDARVIHVHEVFAWPVLIASLATVIGLLVSLAPDPLGAIGEELTKLAGLVIVAESVMVMLVSGDKWRWLRGHWVMVVLSAAVLGLFVVGVAVPLHLMRLVRGFGASHVGHVLQHAKVLHVGEFGHAKEHLSESSRLAERLQRPVEVAIGLAVPAYIVGTLIDPESDSRELVRLAEDLFVGAHWRLGVAVAIVGAVVLVARRRGRKGVAA